MRRDLASVHDMIGACANLQAMRPAGGLAALESDLVLRSAILHQLILVGEAAKRVSQSYRQSHDTIPWRLVAGMRDKLIHEYDGVDLGEVWETLAKDIPTLRAKLEELVANDSSIG